MWRNQYPQHTVSGNIKWCRCGKHSGSFLKLNIQLPYDADIHPREIKTCPKTSTQMFVAILSIISQKWKQPKYSSTDEQITK